jgi:Zn-dependent peptidase ImmA (M78 family)/transcriptional regulator with XRE-family HTH domain
MLTPFGKSVRQFREDKGLRLYDLAKLLNMSPAFVSGVETGRKAIPDSYVTAVVRALGLTASEAKALRLAADRTRKEVRVSHLSEEQRALVAAFARRLDSDPDGEPEDELLKKLRAILKSCTGEIPFKRKRRGMIVPPMSAAAIRSFAEKVRSVFVEDDQIAFPIIDVLENKLGKAIPGFHLDVVEKDIMGDDEGRVIAGTGILDLRVDVYEAACMGNGRARFTACHELAHFLLHREVTMARSRDEGTAIYRDSEWQADTFGGALMMSARHLPEFEDNTDAAFKCGMSAAAAEHQWKIYIKEGLVD